MTTLWKSRRRSAVTLGVAALSLGAATDGLPARPPWRTDGYPEPLGVTQDGRAIHAEGAAPGRLAAPGAPGTAAEGAAVSALRPRSTIVSHGDELRDRTFAFTYEMSLDPLPADAGPVDIFVPLAQSDPHQEILSREVESTIRGEERTEEMYGNRFWHGHLDSADGKPIRLTVQYVVRRKVFRNLKESTGDSVISFQEDTEALRQFLGPNRRVPVTGPLIEGIRNELRPRDGSAAARARAIYDYVIDHMEYKKVGTGWGNGDTFWACSMKYGNCTDFHALFISLARAEGIPARFEIGFPIPEDRPAGDIAGYHCWVEFHLPDRGWTPIDASEAWKHPQRRDLYFGTHPADRFQFTIGRDLMLGEGHTTGPLNYFIYPHVEVGGRNLTDFRTRFNYRAS